MSFFEPPPPSPEPPPDVYRQPPWMGPPRNVLGGVVALELLVARSEKAAIWIASATAYPTGLEFALEVRWRPEVREVAVGRGLPWHYEHRQSGELPDDLFRAGIQFADGSKVTSLGGPRLGWPAVSSASRPGDEPEGPVLFPRGGGGGGDSWSQALWLWPLPSGDSMTFVCEWPALDIELSRAPVDLAPIRDAAARSRTLWEDDDEPDSGGGSSVSLMGPTPVPPRPSPRQTS